MWRISRPGEGAIRPTPPVGTPLGEPEPGLTLRVGPATRMEAALADERGRVLLAVRYGATAPGLGDADHPFVDIPNPVLDGAPRIELWGTPKRVARFRRDDLAWAEDGRALLGCRCRRVGDNIEADALVTYRELLALLDERGYPCLQRVWNYVPGINEEQRGVERYKRFNVGRARGFEERFGKASERHYSAASAVGTMGDTLIVCFAAGREPGTHIENPRQISAPRYPPAYGPRSPCFARATFAPAGWGRALFLSGTASVVGHETRHRGHPLRQLEEVAANIDALLRGADAPPGRGRLDVVRFDLLKIYVRDRDHFAPIREAVARRVDPSMPVIYLLADLCRNDLLLEIEGVSLQVRERADERVDAAWQKHRRARFRSSLTSD
jgi:chorismate lyase/3-hydroxybenzoate synthase